MASEEVTDLKDKKIAIVHDWLIAGGAEKVVLELHRMFPEAPIYTSYATREWRRHLNGKVRTGFLQYWPFSRLRKFIPFLRIWWFSRLKFKEYDLVISTSGAEAKGIKTPPDTIHISYIHAPTHYYWSRYDEYLEHPGFGPFDWLARVGLKILVGPLRRWDFKAAQRADFVIANSTHTQEAIDKYYNRSSAVIFPPVDTEKFAGLNEQKRHGLIITGRQTPYKRFDLAVKACTELGLPLTVVGDGPDNKRLRKLAGPTIKFTGFVKDSEVAHLVASAEAFIFPGIDDFGIAPVEALASGTPVIAYKAGGALDYVVPGKTGEFFEEQSVESLVKVLENFDSSKYIPTDIKTHAQKFSIDEFHAKITDYLQDALY